MARCDVCGNGFDRAFQLSLEGQIGTFAPANESMTCHEGQAHQ
jgi:hypothetical protein